MQCDADVEIPIYLDENTLVGTSYTKYRPFIFDFLDDMKEKYELILYTSLDSYYVHSILKFLEKDKVYFDYVFDKDFCVFTNMNYGVKCLDFLMENRTEENIILVDTTPKCLPKFADNFVPILPFENDDKDIELVKLAKIIDYIMKGENIQEEILNLVNY